MTFASIDFAVFFVGVVAVHWALPARARNPWLLGASYLFYGWVDPWLAALLFGVTATNWGCARVLDARPDLRRLALGAAIVLTLGVLGAFKYLDFFGASVGAALGRLGVGVPEVGLGLVLPVGLSFYTFQALSYTIDVARGETPARRNLADVALYVSFFPQLVAGPIERAGDLLPQLERPRTLTPARVEAAVLLFAWGFFKKLVVADQLAPVVDHLFALGDASAPLVHVGAYAFALQIYADFSAYTDIARGAAHLLGVDLVRNFETPYLSTSIGEFWRRWHTSLTRFFRDYVYLPLAGSRPTDARLALALVATFGLSGLWHGAGWNFVVWGLYHGVLLLLERAWTRVGGPAYTRGWAWAPVKWGVTFVLVALGLVVFREADGLGWALRNLAQRPWAAPAEDVRVAGFLFGHALVLTAPVWIGDGVARWREARGATSALPFGLRAAAVPALVAATLVFAAEAPVSFLYFRF